MILIKTGGTYAPVFFIHKANVMLTVNQISKSYELLPLLSNVSFSVNAGEKWGLVGPNGSGKTTLLRLITGQEAPDKGSITLTPSSLRVGYLPQGFQPDPDESMAAFLWSEIKDVGQLSSQLETLAGRLGADPHDEALHDTYERILADLTLASEQEGLRADILSHFGFGDTPLDTPVRHLSGGQKTRLALSRILIARPELLILDEPTNHLDIEMLEWLEDYLRGYAGALLVVSHDRAFLDNVVTGILEINPLRQSLKSYAGNYSDYLDQKENENQKQWQAFTDQQQEIRRLRKAASVVRDAGSYHKGGKTDLAKNRDKFTIGFFSDRSAATHKRAKGIETRIQHLLTDERVDRPDRFWRMKIDFATGQESSRSVLDLRDLSVGYNGIPLLADLNLQVRFGDRLVLAGANGCGKTTLLRTVMGEIEPVAGSLQFGPSVRKGYMAQEQENLPQQGTPLELMLSAYSQNETEVRSYLSKYLFKGDEVFKTIPLMSYGERARLSLAMLVAQGCNFLLLDEPINHLDIAAREQFEKALAGFEGTVLAVVHDRYFIQRFATRLWMVSAGHIRDEQLARD